MGQHGVEARQVSVSPPYKRSSPAWSRLRRCEDVLVLCLWWATALRACQGTLELPLPIAMQVGVDRRQAGLNLYSSVPATFAGTMQPERCSCVGTTSACRTRRCWRRMRGAWCGGGGEGIGGCSAGWHERRQRRLMAVARGAAGTAATVACFLTCSLACVCVHPLCPSPHPYPTNPPSPSLLMPPAAWRRSGDTFRKLASCSERRCRCVGSRTHAFVGAEAVV